MLRFLGRFINTAAIASISMCLSSMSFGSDCTAPENVKKLAELLETTFDGSLISCDDGSSFSSQFDFECYGDSYQTTLTKDKKTKRADGSEAYVLTQLKQNDSGEIKLNELSYLDFETFASGGKPDETVETKFISMSDKSFSFYSASSPTDASWISSVWFIADGQEKAQGYKIYSNKAVKCKSATE